MTGRDSKLDEQAKVFDRLAEQRHKIEKARDAMKRQQEPAPTEGTVE